MRRNRLYPYAAFLLLVLLVTVSACKGRGSSADGGSELAKTAAVPEPAQAGSGAEAFAAGTAAPDFTLTDIHGKKISLKDLRGKTVLLNFWATWCVPCVAEMGSLQRLYKAYQAQNFEIVGINVDSADTNDTVLKFVKDNGISFSILRDTELAFPPVYGLSGFPETFIIGPDGKFVSFFDPGESKPTVRVVGDRAWDSPAFLKSIKDALEKK